VMASPGFTRADIETNLIYDKTQPVGNTGWYWALTRAASERLGTPCASYGPFSTEMKALEAALRSDTTKATREKTP
jgi:hypothetical protein